MVCVPKPTMARPYIAPFAPAAFVIMRASAAQSLRRVSSASPLMKPPTLCFVRCVFASATRAPVEKVDEQAADGIRLLLLYPMTGAFDEMRGDHLRARHRLHALE